MEFIGINFWDICVPVEISAPSSDADFNAKVQIVHPNPRFEWGETCHVEDKKRWRKPWEELQRRHPSPRTDRHAIDVACTGKEQQKYSLQISAAWVTPTPLHHGDLEGGTPRKIISRKTVKIRVKRHSIWQKYQYKEIVKQRSAMIERSPGCDDPYASISEAAGVGRGRWSQGPAVHQRGAWMKEGRIHKVRERHSLQLVGTENKKVGDLQF